MNWLLILSWILVFKNYKKMVMNRSMIIHKKGKVLPAALAWPAVRRHCDTQFPIV